LKGDFPDENSKLNTIEQRQVNLLKGDLKEQYNANKKTVEQIGQLQFVKGTKAQPEHYNARIYKRKKFVDDPNNPLPVDWVQDNFVDNFWGGLRTNPGKWVTVPLGHPKLDIAPKELLSNVECKYQQKEEQYCLVFALASALHYVGMVEAAQKLVSIADNTTNMNMEDQINVIKAHMVECAPSIGHFEAFGQLKKRKKKMLKFDDIIQNRTAYPTIVIPVGGDYSTNHAVCVVDDLIFDSTQKFALKLKMSSFNWVVDCKDGVVSFYGGIRFCQRVSSNSQIYARKVKSNW